MRTIPRIVIAGTHSGCGKTTVASGIMAALVARGLMVQPFKVGPDFIDPSHHTKICGRASRNLDPFMMGEDGCLETFVRASRGADIAIIEGVMGMYDGLEGSDLASTAHVARILNAPVILVTDVRGTSRSVNALTLGFSQFDLSVNIAGIIHNRTGSRRHQEMIASSAVIPSFGWIPRRDEIVLKSRHLGLVMAHESDMHKAAGQVIEECADVDAIIAAARSAPPLALTNPASPNRLPEIRIGVACDSAFCFYYRDNLDRLRNAGADLVFFSPLLDSIPDVSGIYLGGGYPELHLPALESSEFIKNIRTAVNRGFPVYAECGGLISLTREFAAEKTYRMAGIFPADAEMTKNVQALGYVKGEVTDRHPILSGSQNISGHEFHYSRITPDRDVLYGLRLSRGKGIESSMDGMIVEGAAGTYTHAYFSSKMAGDIVAAAKRYHEDS